MSKTAVALTRCQSYDQPQIAQAIARQLQLLGGLERFVKRGDTVLLKPNFIAPRSHRYATQTHPSVVLEVARLLKDCGARPFVGDSPAWSNVFACARALRLDEPLKKLGVPICQLDKPRWCRIGNSGTKVGISSHALDADVIINLPKLKSHQQLVATFAIKNMFGCVCGKRKALWHFLKGGDADEFCELLIDIYRFLKPALTIIDAVFAMDGQGPIRGRTRPLGWLIGGADLVACEIACARLVNINPADLPILQTAHRLGFGSFESNITDWVGDFEPQDACRDFQLPRPTPLRFSLVHVCKSIARQIVLLAKAGRSAKYRRESE